MRSNRVLFFKVKKKNLWRLIYTVSYLEMLFTSGNCLIRDSSNPETNQTRLKTEGGAHISHAQERLIHRPHADFREIVSLLSQSGGDKTDRQL